MKSNPKTSSATAFDAIADRYDAELQRGLAVSGEGKEYFTENRVNWVAEQLARLGARPRRIMDFGCGTGSATKYLMTLPDAESLVGIDVSEASLDVARHMFGSSRTSFQSVASHRPAGDVDLAFCNGVFHHVPIADRTSSVDHVFRSLRPGGLFAFWENNPLNPGARIVMRRCSFDRDAQTLTAGAAKRLLQAGGFEILGTNFLFIFPRILRFLRWSEPLVSSWPLGAQYLVLCQRPPH